MNGSIRCVRCHSGIDEHGSGICPKCNRVKSCYIDLYWDGDHRRLRFGLDWNGMKKKLRKIRSEIDEGTFDLSAYMASASNQNLLEARFEEWLTVREGDDLAPATLELYRYNSKAITAGLGNEDVTKIDYETLDIFFKQLPLRGTSKRTLRAILHVFFVWLRRKKIITSIPPFPVVSAKGAKPKYVITIEQQEQAIGRLPEALQDVVRLMTYVGRVSEILTLRIGDADLEKREVTISRTWSARQIKENTKTDTPRTFPLYGAAVDIIRRNLKGRIGDVYLFAQKNGEPYSYNYILWVWRKYSGLKIPLKDATRRSWATNMRNTGVKMEAIQRGLGHKSLKTTEIYLADDATWAREEFEKADRILRFPKARDERVTKK